MRFEFVFFQGVLPLVEIWFRSSKEEIMLGTLRFEDLDGDNREDVQQLLGVALKATGNPMLQTKGVE